MAKKFNVLLYEKMHTVGTAMLEEKCNLNYAESHEEEYLVKKAMGMDALIIRANGAITRTIIEANPSLKVIGRHGVGLDAIDLTAAKNAGVKVVYTPVANTVSVAEHFMALTLNLAKRIQSADAELRKGNWQARHVLEPFELNGKKLGVCGFGKIGQQIARMCQKGLNMEVLYNDVVEWPDVAKELGARKVEIEQLFGESDVISINLPLLEATKQSVNKSLLQLMKPTAILVNMARGPIWKEEDVYDVLKNKLIAGVASDVFEVEPASVDNPLFSLHTFVGTPHMSAHSEEAMIKMSLVAEDVLNVLEGRAPQFPVV